MNGGFTGKILKVNLTKMESEVFPMLEDMFIKEAHAAITDSHGIGSPLIDIFPLKK